MTDKISNVSAVLVQGPYSGANINETGDIVIGPLLGEGAQALIIRFDLDRDGVRIRQHADPHIVVHATEADATEEAVNAEIAHCIAIHYPGVGDGDL